VIIPRHFGRSHGVVYWTSFSLGGKVKVWMLARSSSSALTRIDAQHSTNCNVQYTYSSSVSNIKSSFCLIYTIRFIRGLILQFSKVNAIPCSARERTTSHVKISLNHSTSSAVLFILLRFPLPIDISSSFSKTLFLSTILRCGGFHGQIRYG
jgi:hypothetical protein